MDQQFHMDNRAELYRGLEDGSVVVAFSGHAPRKTGDELYPFFANRNFVYLTGVDQQQSILLAVVQNGAAEETLFVLPHDLLAERWTGARYSNDQLHQLSGISNIQLNSSFASNLDLLLKSSGIDRVYLDFDKLTADEPDSEAYQLAAYLKTRYPFLTLKNLSRNLRRQRVIKKPCEIEAMRKAQTVTKAGIEAMMRAAKPGMYEYQLKAEFDYALAQRGVLSPGFPSIVSSGKNNFCIHYYAYQGQLADGDMVLNDVGACWGNEINDVSRGWPVNGKFTEKQALLYQCAYSTSQHMFSLLKPGFPMKDVDETARRFNYEQLKEIGLCKQYDDIKKYMWHGGAHHVGFDVHDNVDIEGRLLEPGMVFCVDIGIYCEEWGIGFRLEDNCLVTENGCENLSAITPRSIEDIEAFMGKR